MAPVGGSYSLYGQDLVLLEKGVKGLKKKTLMKVSYVPLTGEYGYSRREPS
jgi:outer membrane protease